jgi:hypothetical protein
MEPAERVVEGSPGWSATPEGWSVARGIRRVRRPQRGRPALAFRVDVRSFLAGVIAACRPGRASKRAACGYGRNSSRVVIGPAAAGKRKRTAGNPLSADGPGVLCLLPKVEDTRKVGHTSGEGKSLVKTEADLRDACGPGFTASRGRARSFRACSVAFQADDLGARPARLLECPR